ncbi:MAG: hypothetical protein WBP22_01680 [Candidatus Saccharimonas sp.]
MTASQTDLSPDEMRAILKELKAGVEFYVHVGDNTDSYLIHATCKNLVIRGGGIQSAVIGSGSTPSEAVVALWDLLTGIDDDQVLCINPHDPQRLEIRLTPAGHCRVA